MGTESLFLLFLKGVLIGFVIAAPVGPIGILSIRRAAAGRYGLSLATGFGAGLADTVYGAIAAFSLVGITELIARYDTYLRLGGGMLILWVGYSIFRTPFQEDPLESQKRDTFLGGVSSAFFITLSNPVVLIVFAAAFAVMGISPAEDSLTQGFVLVGAVFTGANGWWFLLSTLIILIHRRITPRQLLWINRISGTMLLGFGAYILLSLL